MTTGSLIIGCVVTSTGVGLWALQPILAVRHDQQATVPDDKEPARLPVRLRLIQGGLDDMGDQGSRLRLAKGCCLMPEHIRTTRTHTYTATYFADPYKVCEECDEWVDGVLNAPRQINLPCHHQARYISVCPSWGPVDGCQCVEHLGRHHHRERDLSGAA